MKTFTPVKLFLLFLVFTTLACKKETNAPSPEQQLAEKRKADAAFNNNITPGVGNILIEEKLVPDASNQLIFKMAVNGDTLAGYGKINASGQLQYLSSTVLAKKGNTELLVTEMFPDVSKSRMYTILNGKKGSIVVEMNHVSATRVSMSVLDYNWESGEYIVIKKSYFENGNPISDYSAAKLMEEGGDRVYNCANPQPSEDISKAVDNQLDYFQCGGHAYDTYPALKAIKDAILSAVESLKNAAQYQPKLDELKSIELNYKYLNDIFKSINGKFSGYKFEKSILAGLLRDLAEKINELKAKLNPDVQLVPFVAGSLTEYDEVTDREVKLSFTLIDNKTGLPYIKEPVFIDMKFVVPGTNTVVYSETKPTGTNNGMVTFKWDPTTIPNYQNYRNLTAQYAFTSKNWNPSATKNITLSFIKPKLIFLNGGAVVSQVTFVSGDKKTFKLVNEDGRDIPVNYNDVTLTNSNAKVGYTMLKGTYNFDLTLTNNETTDQLTSIDVIYKQKKLTTISALVVPPCGTAPAIQSVTLDCNSGRVRINVAFTADGTGITPYGGSGYCDPSQSCYPVRLYFLNPGATEWSIAYNGYSASLVSGTNNQGVVGITISNCISGKSARESLQSNYPGYRWKVELINKCNKRSSAVEF